MCVTASLPIPSRQGPCLDAQPREGAGTGQVSIYPLVTVTTARQGAQETAGQNSNKESDVPKGDPAARAQ